MGDRDRAAMNLDVVAAVAKQLADDLRAGRLWPGQAASSLGEIERALSAARSNVGNDR